MHSATSGTFITMWVRHIAKWLLSSMTKFTTFFPLTDLKQAKKIEKEECSKQWKWSCEHTHTHTNACNRISGHRQMQLVHPRPAISLVKMQSIWDESSDWLSHSNEDRLSFVAGHRSNSPSKHTWTQTKHILLTMSGELVFFHLCHHGQFWSYRQLKTKVVFGDKER